jgi:hypothetical protein
MGLISCSAQAMVSFINMPFTASANTSGIVACHLLATLITGWVTAHVPFLSYEFCSRIWGRRRQ